jgi:hypothetical protein
VHFWRDTAITHSHSLGHNGVYLTERLVSGRDSLRHYASIDRKKGQKEGSKSLIEAPVPFPVRFDSSGCAALKKRQWQYHSRARVCAPNITLTGKLRELSANAALRR